jgi:hypothetical protein
MKPLPLQHSENVIIGVTGHRALKNQAQIRSIVDQVIDDIKQAHPESSLVVLSPLAEGADRLVARQVLAQDGSRLIVAMPMRKIDYMSDFETQDSIREFNELLDQASEIIELPGQSLREGAYADVGRYILDRCDLLIALWDGQKSEGVGGTGEIVALARERGMPLAWIRVMRPNVGGRSGISDDEYLEKLHYENFSDEMR